MHKEKVQQLLDSCPEDVDIDAFLEKAIVLAKIEAAERQIANGETVTHEDAKKQLKKWLE